MNSSEKDSGKIDSTLSGWALILGASSGFGEAISLALAKAGLNIFGVHLDRRARMPHVQSIQDQIESVGRKSVFFNVNAADEAKRKHVLNEIDQVLKTDSTQISVFVHSLAFGTLLPYWSSEENSKAIQKRQIEMTSDVMAHSLVYWVQDLLSMNLFSNPAKIFAMTSAGSQVVWPGYGAVSSAKAALEAHIRQLAVELAPLNITANAICAGVTDTPALHKIPGHEAMIEKVKAQHPYKRLTTPEDVAGALVALCQPSAQWINGNTLFVDGGEHITG